MHIIVPIKQVPETDELRYDPVARTLVREGVTTVINAYDKRALTEALRLRDLYGGSVTAITMGPRQARAALVECLGRGVDRAVHLTDRAFAGADTLATARTLAAALKRLRFDLLLPGNFSTDSETGQVGPELAELLDLPQVTGATAIELAGGKLIVTRETDSGFETVECPLPALLTAAEHLIKPAKTKPPVIAEGERRIAEDPTLIETWSAYDLGLEAADVGLSGSPTWVAELRPVMLARERIMLEGDPFSTANSLLLQLDARGLRAGSPLRDTRIELPQKTDMTDPGRMVWAVAELLHTVAGRIPASAYTNDEPVLRPVSLELAGEAARLALLVGGGAGAVVMGGRVNDSVIADLGRHGAGHVLVADDARLQLFTAETYAWVLARAIEEYTPWAVLLPATSFGRDVASRVAARLGLGLTGDCTGFEVDGEGRLLGLKPAFGGQVIAPILSRTLPYMATVRPGALPIYAPHDTSRPRVTRLEMEGLPGPRIDVLYMQSGGEAGLALDRARLVVSVGTGIGGSEALPDVYRLASLLGAWMGLKPGEIAVGGTRKVVDEGWLPRHQQVGITGRSVAPDLYVGLGLQGNFNHTAGIMRAGTIVAVNNDPEAPIFDMSDIGVVSDWRDFAGAIEAALAIEGTVIADEGEEGDAIWKTRRQ